MTRHLLAIGLLGFALPAFSAQVPRPSPEFVIRLVDGQQKLLSQYRGKVVALEFLYTTCPHCQACSATMNRLYKEYGPKGFQPVGVAFNDMATLLVPDYVNQLRLQFPVGVGSRDEVVNYLQFSVMERMSVPQLVFIDKKGVIRAQHMGGDEFFQTEEASMRQMIEKLLKEPAAAAEKKTPARSSRAKPKASSPAAFHSRPQAVK